MGQRGGTARPDRAAPKVEHVHVAVAIVAGEMEDALDDPSSED
jgi:hypothetical protein